MTNFNRFQAKKKSKWPTQKSRVFQPPPKAEQFSPKFHGLIDAKGIDVALPIWLRYLTKILYFRHFITFWIEWVANLSTNY
jgi:hypothetical protein